MRILLFFFMLSYSLHFAHFYKRNMLVLEPVNEKGRHGYFPMECHITFRPGLADCQMMAHVSRQTLEVNCIVKATLPCKKTQFLI